MCLTTHTVTLTSDINCTKLSKIAFCSSVGRGGGGQGGAGVGVRVMVGLGWGWLRWVGVGRGEVHAS